jgi:hypothetical protein
MLDYGLIGHGIVWEIKLLIICLWHLWVKGGMCEMILMGRSHGKYWNMSLVVNKIIEVINL